MAAAYHVEHHAATDAKRVLTIIHGLGEHTRRYDDVIRWFTAHDTAVTIGDLPGHGQSLGLPGHIDHFADYVQAAKAFHDSAVANFGDALPHFLLGHSMGGLITVLAAPQIAECHTLHGVLLSSPLFGLALQVSPIRLAVGRALARIAPKLRQPNGIAADAVTRNRAIAAAYAADQLVTKTVTLGWFFACNTAIALAHEQATQFHLPIAVWQAGDDKIVSAAKTRDWIIGCASADKLYDELPGLYHELLNEPEREDVLTAMHDYMVKH